jgi:hypothetical protein
MTVRVNLLLNQGATFYQQVEITDQNGDPLQVTFANGDPVYTAAAQMRKSYFSSNASTFTTGLSNGMLTLSMTANSTVNIEGGRYVYDVELTSSNSVSRIIEGHVQVLSNVTK